MSNENKPEKPAAESKSTRRGWKIALALSLSLNLLVAGLVAGTLLSHDGTSGRPPFIRDEGMSPLTRALEKEDRDALRAALRARNQDRSGQRRNIRRLNIKLVNALRADPFDVSELARIFDQLQAGHMAQQDLGEQELLSRIEAMTPEARAAFADRLKRDNRGPIARKTP